MSRIPLTLSPDSELKRLITRAKLEKKAILFRLVGVSLGNFLLVQYLGNPWFWLWSAGYVLAHFLNIHFLTSRKSKNPIRDLNIASVLFMILLSSFYWLPAYLIALDDRVLNVVGAALTGAILVFMLRRSDTWLPMVLGQITVFSLLWSGILLTWLYRLESFGQQLGVLISVSAMIGYFAQAIMTTRQQKISEDIALDQLRYLAGHDQLTGLPTYRKFHQSLNLRNRQTHHGQLGVFYLDADNLKWTNDGFGHPAGDALLVALADATEQTASDAKLLFCRKSGDEFLVAGWFPDTHAFDAFGQVLRRATNTTFDHAGRRYPLSTSIGAAVSQTGKFEFKQLETNAEIALREAKTQKATLVIFSERLANRELRQNKLAQDLKRALSQGELSQVFQMIFDAKTRRPVAAEALVRWQHPEYGWVPPGDIVDLCYAQGIGAEFTQYILAGALKQARNWPGHMVVSVNVRPIEMARADFVDRVKYHLDAFGFDPRRLWLEITEDDVLSDSPLVADNLRRLRALGVLIAIDDFGAGYSSIDRILEVDFDVLKLDRKLIVNSRSNPPAMQFLGALLDLAAANHKITIVEGVEDDEDCRAAQNAGADYLQGYGLGRPEMDIRLNNPHPPAIATHIASG